MKFYDGAPIFAAEVRSESDYGPDAEAAMARKRADYFAAGTLVSGMSICLATSLCELIVRAILSAHLPFVAATRRTPNRPVPG